VRIRARTFGVGQPDAIIRKGIYKWMPPLPVNPGNDAAGIIDAVGADVRGIKIGQKVLLSARDLAQRGGCYAEYIVAPAEAVHLLADDVDLETAVCLANYQVAWALLNDMGAARPLQSILVIGAAGGVGSALTQLAKLAGIRVIGSVSTPEKAAFARAMGADDVIFYRDEDVIARTLELTGGRGVDLVLDHICGPQFVSYLKVLAKWGTLVSFNAFDGLPEENLIAEMRNYLDKCPAVRCFSFHIYDDDKPRRREIMREIIGKLESGAIKPAIFAKLPLSEVRQAHTLLDAGSALGKIIMTA
jgi:NADPH2:quinone reductase